MKPIKPIDIVKDLIVKKSKGRQLKTDLGLDKFKYAYIQKVIDMAQDVYIVTVDSRYPNVFFGRSKLNKVDNVSILKTKMTPFGYSFKN